MAEYKDSRGISCFRPDDTETEFYLDSNYTKVNLGDILELAYEKWGESIDINDINIAAEYIHTECLGYDLYDAGDYTRYLRIEYIPPKSETA